MVHWQPSRSWCARLGTNNNESVKRISRLTLRGRQVSSRADFLYPLPEPCFLKGRNKTWQLGRLHNLHGPTAPLCLPIHTAVASHSSRQCSECQKIQKGGHPRENHPSCPNKEESGSVCLRSSSNVPRQRQRWSSPSFRRLAGLDSWTECSPDSRSFSHLCLIDTLRLLE